MTTLKKRTLTKKQPLHEFVKSNEKMEVNEKDKYKPKAFVNFEYTIAQKLMYKMVGIKKSRNTPHALFLKNCDYEFGERSYSIESIKVDGYGLKVVYFFADNSTVFFHDGAYRTHLPNKILSAWGIEQMPKQERKPENKTTRPEIKTVRKPKIMVRRKNPFGVMQ